MFKIRLYIDYDEITDLKHLKYVIINFLQSYKENACLMFQFKCMNFSVSFCIGKEHRVVYDVEFQQYDVLGTVAQRGFKICFIFMKLLVWLSGWFYG